VEIADCLTPGTARVTGISIPHATESQNAGPGLPMVVGLEQACQLQLDLPPQARPARLGLWVVVR
jgi:hypothetical protein